MTAKGTHPLDHQGTSLTPGTISSIQCLALQMVRGQAGGGVDPMASHLGCTRTFGFAEATLETDQCGLENPSHSN